MPVDCDIKPLLGRMFVLNLKREYVSRLCSVSASALSLAANGKKDLPYLQWREVERLITDCEILASRSSMGVLDWRETDKVTRLLANLRDEKDAPIVPLTDAESLLLRRFARGTPVEVLADECGVSRERLLENVEQLLKRSQRLADAAKRFAQSFGDLNCRIAENNKTTV